MREPRSRSIRLARQLLVSAVLLAAACADGTGPAPSVTGVWFNSSAVHLYLTQRGDSVTGTAHLGVQEDRVVSGVYSEPYFILTLQGLAATNTLVVHFADDQTLSGVLYDNLGKHPITLSRR